ncbi:probable glycerol-3-phosphate acyltransferase 3 [Cornus florida]|uniref:probable glycerol-3-phosphate acyltransferase 3 n=1 Tax=Cornus florida TaxID=4283 RepID=UPI00289C4D89|nr:probable glycerol-3-phosphate acyltransferase 3 [Cornus florida]
MVSKAFFKTLLLFFFRLLLKHFRNPKSLHRSFSNSNYHLHASSLFKFQRFPPPPHSSQTILSNLSTTTTTTLIFSVEGSLLKSSSLFPYFMLVAFEAGSLFRAILLFVLYPFVCLLSHETGLKIMVMVCFLGIKKDKFRVGTSVLPKFFLEDVGLESFELLTGAAAHGNKLVGVSDLPRVMVECFLRDYLKIECVVARDLKVFCGYFLGVMEEERNTTTVDQITSSNVIGITSSTKPLDHHLFSHCKEIYLVNEADRRSWHNLPRDRYPEPLIFHDGRLALRPTPLAIVAMFMWIPFGLTLAIIRTVVGLSLPYNCLIPILVFSGLRLKVVTKSNHNMIIKEDSKAKAKAKGLLYVSNHRTLLDPLYLSFGLKKPLSAVTYSLSRLSEILAPIRTVRLTRDRVEDSKIMEKLLDEGDMIIFPEGTTCREPHLLRFSPLFSEMSVDIVPVAMDTCVSMFYGTTASGFKCLDPLFFLMNPSPTYTIHFLDKIITPPRRSSSSSSQNNSRFEVANYIQTQLAMALGFQCTTLTRTDKYLILAGNEGVVLASTSTSTPTNFK